MKGFWCTRHLEMVGGSRRAGPGRAAPCRGGPSPRRWCLRHCKKATIRSPRSPSRSRSGALHSNFNCPNAATSDHFLVPDVIYSLVAMAWRGAPHGELPQAAAVNTGPSPNFAEAWEEERRRPGARAPGNGDTWLAARARWRPLGAYVPE